MVKKQLSMTIDGDLLDRLDVLAEEKRMSRSECVARLLEQALGDDGSGLVEFFRLKAPAFEIVRWMQNADFLKHQGTITDEDDGMTELVFRVTRKQMKKLAAKRGLKAGDDHE